MSYRDAEPAWRERTDELEREIATLDAEIAAKSVDLDDLTTATSSLGKRIDQEGPGGGEAGARLLRIPLLVGTMLGIGAVALFFQICLAVLIGGRESLPAYAIMSGPTLIGSYVAHRYRSAFPAYWLTALLMTVATVLFFVLGAGRVGR